MASSDPTPSIAPKEDQEPQESPEHTEVVYFSQGTWLSSGSSSGENKLRPAGDIINRIRWDPEFDPSDYVIVFLDRFEGELQVEFTAWKKESTHEEFIPQHRVLYIKTTNGEVIWDRRRRIDKIFNSGNSAFSELAFLA